MIHRSLIATVACAILLCTPVFSFAQYGGYGHGHGHDDHGNGHGYGHDGDDDDDDDGNNGHGDDHGHDDDDHGHDDDDHGNGNGNNGNGHGNNGNHGRKPGNIHKENKRKPVVVWSYGRDRAQLRNDVFNFKAACSKGNQKITRR